MARVVNSGDRLDPSASAAPPRQAAPDLPNECRPRPRLGWAAMVSCLALIALAAVSDQVVSDQLTQESVRRVILKPLEFLIALGAALVMLGILAAYPNRRRLWIGYLVPTLLSTAVLHALKWATGRARPLTGLGPFHFEPFAAADKCDSFPSGHTVGAATLAFLLAVYFPRGRWLFYVTAALVGLRRVVIEWHFLSDVLAGYLLAALVVFGCVRLLGRDFYRGDRSVLVDEAG